MENKLILYKDESGKVSVNTRFADELDENLTYKKFLLVRQSRKTVEFEWDGRTNGRKFITLQTNNDN